MLTAAKVPKPAAKAIANSSAARKLDSAAKRTKAVRQASKYSKKLSKHLKAERKKATKKNGEFRKGQSMKKVMAAAHKCVRREMR